MYFLESKELGLRQLTEADVEGNYSNWFNDPVVCKYNSHYKFPKSKEELVNYIRSFKDDRSLLVMAVIEKKSQNHIGNISLQEIDYLSRQAEIAFLFGETDYWNKGYATIAARLMINHAFMELGLNRIYFGTAANNAAMQKIGEKLGFQRSGTRREALFKNGKYYDIYDYDLLKHEWKS